MRNFLDDGIAEHRSNPPLRWIANLCGSLSSGSLLRMMYAEEDEKDKGLIYKIDGFVWDKLFKFYCKYGTFYRLRMDLSGKNWDDYDENGVPYWEKTGTVDPDYDYEKHHWDYVDEETGDALKVINYGRP